MARKAKRTRDAQRVHDHVIAALAREYERRGHRVFTNPGPVKSMGVDGQYPDVIVLRKRGQRMAYAIEVETEESVSETEAVGQWVQYDETFDRWYLAVPKTKRAAAAALIEDHELANVRLISWSFDFDALP